MKVALAKNLHLEKKSFYIALIFLQLITATILGFLILQKVFGLNNPSKNMVNTDPVGSDSETANLPSTGFEARWNENNLLEMPKVDAAEEDRQEHYRLAEKMAKEVSVVEIQDCKGNPVVAKVKKGSNLVFKNNDSIEHLIRGPEGSGTFKIPAKGEHAIVADFVRGPGVHSYGCDSEFGASGIIFLVRQ